MAKHVALYHKTHYKYDRPVTHLPHTVRLRPAPHCRTPILSYSQRVLPKKHFLNWQQDPFSNYLARLVFPEKTNELLIEVDLVAEMAVYNPFDFFLEPTAEKFPFTYEPDLKKELAAFLETSPPGPLLKEYVKSIDLSGMRNERFSGLLEPPGLEGREISHPHGSGGAIAGANPDLALRFLPGFRLAAGEFIPPHRRRRPVCFRLLDSVDSRCQIARRPLGSGAGLHRSSCLDGSLSAGRGVDRFGRHFRAAGRRRPHPAGLFAGSDRRGSRYRNGRGMRDQARP